MRKALIIDMIAFLLIVLFLYTGISKLMEYQVFKEQVAVSPILIKVAPLISIGLPVVEIIVAIMLILPRWRLPGLILSLALMAGFTVYIILLLTYSDHLPCSCGGVLAQLSWPQHLAFNIVFIALAIGGIVLERKNKFLSIASKN